jgi:hypothetical protein
MTIPPVASAEVGKVPHRQRGVDAGLSRQHVLPDLPPKGRRDVGPGDPEHVAIAVRARLDVRRRRDEVCLPVRERRLAAGLSREQVRLSKRR